MNSAKSVLPFNKVPGPSTLPVIGTLHHFLPGGSYNGLDLVDLGLKLYDDFGDIVNLKGMLGKQDMVFLYDLDDFEKIYRTEGAWPERSTVATREYYLKVRRPEVFKSVYGLIHSQGKEWQDIRTAVNQIMMQMKTARQYVGWVDEIALDFIKRLETLLDSERKVPKDFLYEMDRWSMESIARIAIDTRLGCLDLHQPENADGFRLIKSLSRYFDLAYQVEILPSMWKYVSTPKFNEIMDIFDCFTEISIKHIQKAIKRLEENPTIDESNLSVLEKLLKIDPQIAIIMALDMFFAGVDTTSSTSLSTLYFLSKNPDKQDRLREEINSKFPRGSTLTAEGLNSLSYLKACIKETQRLKPIAVGILRNTGADLVLGGYSVPKGTQVLMCHHLAARVKKQFPDEHKYMPERWLRAGSEGFPSAQCAHKFSYMPFGFGPRMCVGRRFAELEMEVLLTRIITNYRLHWTGPDMQYKSTLITGPIGPFGLHLNPI
ncbi:cytochrome P450 12b1, mitochondrial-like [Ctenocephalides felis]|uniref:cytochrome P450 12b1, mitochondrial-like n=1 Tax=Ctenocephalides felis TaxID=7515 RepID=UPI000E6E1AD0|nr:cytochrome P450 12b1, mitochondrial-like [Ctenocephalides felis]